MSTTPLHRNPFYILGVSPLDDRRTILGRAEEKLLLSDSEEIEKAKATLMAPRTRLEAEVCWLPGVDPSQATGFVRELAASPGRFVNPDFRVPVLAHANLLAASFEGLVGSEQAEQLPEMIRQFALLVSRISPEDASRDLNQDRLSSGFPVIADPSVLVPILDERQRYYRDAIKTVLDSLPSNRLVSVLTEMVEGATEMGTAHAPPLIDGLVAAYEVEAQEFLRREADNARLLIDRVRRDASESEGNVDASLSRLIEVVSNWDRVAQPIQVNFQARGQNHEASIEIAHMVRSLAVDLHNDHGLLAQAKKLVEELRTLFAELPEFAERLAADHDALEEVERARRSTASDRARWEQELSYRAEVGVIFKTVLEISPESVSWGSLSFPLAKINRVRWGGVQHRTMGVPSGATFTIAFGDQSREAVVTLRRREVYSAFVERLHRVVGFRLMMEYVNALGNGASLRFGDLDLLDHGVGLTRTKFWGQGEPEYRPWSQVGVQSADGSFYVSALDDRKLFVALPYLETDNTPVVESLIRIGLKSGKPRLSQAFA